MPKKLAQTSEAGSGGPDVTARIIHCPACACGISSDGKKLITRSPKMEEYADLDKAFDKIEARLKDAEKTNLDLQAKNRELEEKLKNVGQQRQEQPATGSATDSGKPSWYKRKS